MRGRCAVLPRTKRVAGTGTAAAVTTEWPREVDTVETIYKPLAGKRLGVFGKGGCGKSTVAVLLAGNLKRQGYEVCVIDADSTNVGGGRVTCPVDDPRPLAGAELSIDDIPPAYRARTPEGIHFVTLGKMGMEGAGAGCDGPIAKVARDLRIRSGAVPMVTLLDFKAGFEDSARGVVIGLDWVIMVIDPTTASIQMAFDMKRMVEQVVAGVHPKTAHLADRELIEFANRMYSEATLNGVSFVLNKVDSEDTEQLLRDQLEEGGIVPIGVFPDDPAVSTSWLRALPLDETRNARSILDALHNLESVVREKTVST
jgi:CO dehydrogenase maturation factor